MSLHNARGITAFPAGDHWLECIPGLSAMQTGPGFQFMLKQGRFGGVEAPLFSKPFDQTASAEPFFATFRSGVPPVQTKGVESEQTTAPPLGARRFGIVGETPVPAARPVHGGQPLSAPLRAFFEPRLGRNLGNVRIHTDARAAQAAREVDARAYTLGRDVVFGAGEYQPDTDSGRRLLAHELVHVAQQGAGAAVLQRKSRTR